MTSPARQVSKSHIAPLFFTTLAGLEASNTGVGRAVICSERASAHYTIQSSSYTPETGDILLDNGNVAVLQVDDIANAKWFGVLGDGTSDDTTALQAALDYANTNGKTLLLESGNYKITSTIFIKGSTKLTGENWGDTRIVNFSNSNGVEVYGLYNTIQDLCITSNTTSAGDGLHFDTNVANSARSSVERLRIENHANNLVFDGSCSDIYCSKLEVLSATSNGIFIKDEALGIFIDGGVIDGGGLAGSNGIKISGGTGNFISNIDIRACDSNGIYMQALNEEILWYWFTNVLADTSTSNGITIEANTNGVIYSLIFNNCWAATNGVHGVSIEEYDNGVIDGVEFNSFRSLDNGGDGLVMNAGKNISIVNGTFSGNTGNGIVANTSEFKIQNTRVGLSSGRTTQQPIGISVVAGSHDNYMITNNDTRGNQFAGIDDNGTGINKVVSNNL